MAKILVVEDDAGVAEIVCTALELERHIVEHAPDGATAIDWLRVREYDAVVLDIGLPGASGLEICRLLRSKGKHVSILMLTGQRTLEQKEAGLDSGADDYLTKPFHVREFTARIRALLRRPHLAQASMLHVGALELDAQQHIVKKGGEVIRLLPREFALLEYLMQNPDRVFTPDQLLAFVWGKTQPESVDAIRTTVKRLRQKLGSEDVIETVHGVGYKIRS